jgi:hypothetical protein
MVRRLVLLRDLLNATLISIAIYELAAKIHWLFTVTIFFTVVYVNFAAGINSNDENVTKNAAKSAR